MARKGRVPIKLDIVGLDPVVFNSCIQSAQAVVDSRGKASSGPAQPSNPEFLKITDKKISSERLALHEKIAAIAIDFQRAYGKSVEIRIFKRSSKKIIDFFLRSQQDSDQVQPEFIVNGVKVYKGIPESFSALDEAIDRAFGKSKG